MRVLIVDDEVYAVAALVRRMDWARYGFEAPRTAYSMRQAQAVFAEETVDLLLCDIEMPQGTGLELFEWVKAYYPQTECVFVTCHDEYSFLRAAMQLGSCDYILKPVDYVQLGETLLEVARRVERRRSQGKSNAAAAQPSLANDAGTSTNPYVARSLSYIEAHLSEVIAISDVADALHLNPQYLMRIFKKEMGCSILQYITSKRIALAARELKESDTPVADVALMCGFDNYSYFTRIFKRITNETPTAFRKSARGK